MNETAHVQDEARRLDPSRWFEDGKFVSSRLAERALEVGHLKRGLDALYVWRGGVYRPDGEQWVRRFCRDELGERFRKNHVNEVLAWLEGEPVTIGDAQPEQWINVANGLLDWRTGTLTPHTPDVLSTAQLPVAWNPDATCPQVQRFLAEVLPDDANGFGFEMMGYAIFPGGNPFRKAFQLLGDGRNGKSKLLGLLQALLGGDNYAAVPLQLLAENRFAAAELFGKVANIAGDIDARALKQTDVFKMATGGDPMMAERKFGQPFTFVCRAVPFFSANEPPVSSDQSPAWFDRWIVVPFTRRFEPGGPDDDPRILDKLTTPEELSGLLARAVEGLRDLMDRGGFAEPGSITDAGQTYRHDLDTAATFVDEECTFHPDAWVGRNLLYKRYRDWCQEEGRRYPLTRRNFYKHLRRNHADTIRDSAYAGEDRFVGIGLKSASPA